MNFDNNNILLSVSEPTIFHYPMSNEQFLMILDCAVGLDLRVYYRGYPNRFEAALSWLEVHILYAKEACI